MMKTRCYINRLTTHDTLTADVKSLIPDATMRRRMSRIVRMGVSTAMECLTGPVGGAQIDAIVTATGLGCLADSEKFLRNVLEQDEELLNPTPFIQSTFNTIGAQTALLCRNHGYNMTYVHRGRSFESALLDAAMRLTDGESHHILVGAADEQTPAQHRIMERMGFWRTSEDGEGAVFLILSSGPEEGCLGCIVELDFPETALDKEEVAEKYAADAVLWNDCIHTGSYPTASARTMARGTEVLAEGMRRVAIYTSYRGEQPSVIILECP